MTVENPGIDKGEESQGKENVERRFLSLEEIILKYPPETEIITTKRYHGKEEEVIFSVDVSRNDEGVAVYFVPASSKWIKPPEPKSGGLV